MHTGSTSVLEFPSRTRSSRGTTFARQAARDETLVLVASEPHHGPGAHGPPARERRGASGPRKRRLGVALAKAGLSRGVRRSPTLVRIGLAAAIACAPVTAALAQGTQPPRNNQQRQPTPGRLSVPVSGTLGVPATPTTPAPQGEVTAAADVTGSFSIQRFARTTEDAVAAAGTLTLSFTDPSSNSLRTIVTQIALPLGKASAAAPESLPGPIAANARGSTAATTQACETLNLALGPLDVSLLGMAVHLDQVNLDLTVVPGASERLGKLLCDVSGLIGGTADPAEVANTLNTLLDMIG